MPPLTPQSLRVAGKALGFTDEAGEAIRQLSKPIRAYHGSPHSFDAFDASKIGTGEGAQSYGHGLYFAGNEAVAKTYRDIAPAVLTPGQRDAAMRAVNEYQMAVQEQRAIDADISRLHDSRGVPAPGWGGILAAPSSDPELAALTARQQTVRARVDELAALASDAISARGVKPGPGHMYEVEIGHPDESLLDWDATLAGQPAAVRESLARFRSDKYDLNPRYGTDQETGATALHRIAHGLGTDMPGASGALLRAGIPGIRYFDRFSRSAGQGTHNYVIFPGAEDKIRILRKYGLLLPAAAAGTNSEE